MTTEVETTEKALEDRRKNQSLVQHWLTRLSEAREREKDFRKKGRELVTMYEAGNSEKHPYNILYSNTDTLAPALYNMTPKPVVKTRFQRKNDALERLSAVASERMISYLMDSGDAEYETFDDVMRQCVLEALVPGRGVVRVKYDATMEKAKDPQGQELETVSYETVCLETVPWDFFLHGYAKKWQKVPWVAFEHQMSRLEVEENFPDKTASVSFSDYSEGSGESSSTNLFGSRTEESKGAELATVYEIWNKATKEVLFITPNAKDGPLKVVKDPLGLEGFFPMPEPLQFMKKISGLVPVALYNVYEQQAEELNTITGRITRLVRALRLRGFYDSTISEMSTVLTAEDNTLIPITNAAQLTSQGISMDKAVWLFPLETLVGALQQLYTQRQQIKAVIFEITGIADIMRGSSQASETLGAQKIKDQWGTLRLKKAQKEVAKFARNTMRVMLELAVTSLDPKTIRSMTGLPFPTMEERRAAQAALQTAKLMPQLQQPIPPETEALASSPAWEEILQMLQADERRQFAVDIETNSTVDAEATEDKQDMAELMNALAQFLNGVLPLVEQQALPFEAAKILMINLLRRFRMGGEVEEALSAMQAPKQQAGDPEAEKALMEAQKQLQDAQRKFQEEVQTTKLKFLEQEQELGLKTRELDMLQEFNRRELELLHQFNQRELQQQEQAAVKAVQMQAKVATVQSSQPAKKGTA